MKCNIKLDVSDQQRNALACLLAGKAVKRLATREDVLSFVQGAVAGLSQETPTLPLGSPSVPAAAPSGALRAPLSPAELATVAELTKAGRSPGYIRGWIYAGRRIHEGNQ